jgi:hypothetical protein
VVAIRLALWTAWLLARLLLLVAGASLGILFVVLLMLYAFMTLKDALSDLCWTALYMLARHP